MQFIYFSLEYYIYVKQLSKINKTVFHVFFSAEVSKLGCFNIFDYLFRSPLDRDPIF